MKMKLLLISCVLGLVAGCKIAIIVPSGGDVVSSNAAHNCAEGNICEFEINSGQLPFSETLTAIPKAGYVFEKWSDGGEFQCGKSTNPTCTISIADSAVGFAAVSLFDSGYAMPIFRDVGFDADEDGVRDELDEDDDNDGIFDVDDPCPTNPDQACGGDYLIANGKIWFQPDLFTNLSSQEIRLVCPEDFELGVNACEGVLNGYNMNGWVWASSFDFEALVQSYGSTYPGDQSCDTDWLDSFYYYGWRTIESNGSISFYGLVLTVADNLFIIGLNRNCIYANVIGYGNSALFYRTP